MARPVTSLPTASAQLHSGSAAASAGPFYSNAVATHGTVSEGEICCSSRVVSPSHPKHQSNRRIAMFYAKNGRFFTAARMLAGERAKKTRLFGEPHPYNFPPNGNGQNAADRIANAMWEIGK